MKKLLLLLAMFISIASFAIPRAKIVNPGDWDAPLKSKPVRFTDPYTVNYWGLIQGSPFSHPYRLQLYAELNTATTVSWDVVLDVYGSWPSYGNPSYVPFIVTIPNGQKFKLINFALSDYDTPNVNWIIYDSEGPH